MTTAYEQAIKRGLDRRGQLGLAEPSTSSPSVNFPPANQNPLHFIRDFGLLPIAGGALGFLGGGGPVGGAVGAGAGEVLAQKLFPDANQNGLDLGSVAGQAALSGIGGPIAGKVLGSLGKGALSVGRGAGVLAGLGKAAPEVASEVGGQVAAKAPVPASTSGLGASVQRLLASTGIKVSPAAYLGAQEAGYNAPDLLRTWLPVIGSDIGKAVGPATQRGFGGTIGQTIKGFEGTIQQGVANSGSNVVAQSSDFVNALTQHMADLQKLPGNQARVNELKNIITEISKKYKKGLTAQDLLDIKRAADSKFGEAIVNEDVGAVRSSAQKVVGNTARSILRETFPDIGDALNNEHQLLLVRDMVQKQVAKESTQGLPTSFSAGLQRLIEGPARKAVSGGGVGKAPGVLSTLAGQAGVRQVAPSGASYAGGVAETPEQIVAQDSAAGKTTSSTNPVTPAMVARAYMVSEKLGKRVEDIYNAYQLATKNKASQSDEFINKATTNIGVLLKEPLLGVGPGTGKYYEGAIQYLGGAGVPDKIIGLNQRYQLLKLNILRAYQGARISDADYELANKYTPAISDTPEAAKVKLLKLQEILTTSTPQP